MADEIKRGPGRPRKKPLILENYERVAGDKVEEMIARNLRMEDDFDPYYIPGWTEQRRANDIAAADDFTWMERNRSTGLKKEDVYRQIGCDPRPLPVWFTPLRVEGASGTPNAQVSRDMMPYKKWGYEPAKWPTHFEPYGYGMPPGFQVTQDGTLRRDDLQLFVVDGRAERAWQDLLAREAKERENPTERHEAGVPIIGTAQQYQETVNFDKEE